MNYLYSIVSVTSQILNKLLSVAEQIKNGSLNDEAKLALILTTLGPILKELSGIIDAEFPQYQSTVDWLVQLYQEFLPTQQSDALSAEKVSN